MSSTYENEPESKWPDEAPGPSDVPNAPSGGEPTGEEEAEENRRRDPPA